MDVDLEGFYRSLDSPSHNEDVSVIYRRESAQLPIILTAPHGGSLQHSKRFIARISGPDISTKSDLYTLRLLSYIDRAIQQKCGRKPYIVAAKFHRKFIDANRNAAVPKEQPFNVECEEGCQAYTAYHQRISDCIEHCKCHHAGENVLLLDVHGQCTYQDYLVLGTRNKKTCSYDSNLALHQVDKPGIGFIWLLRSLLGQAILPSTGSPDIKRYSGGYTVYAHSNCPLHPRDTHLSDLRASTSVLKIDAVQLEFGSALRSPPLCFIAADAVATAAVRTFPNSLGNELSSTLPNSGTKKVVRRIFLPVATTVSPECVSVASSFSETDSPLYLVSSTVSDSTSAASEIFSSFSISSIAAASVSCTDAEVVRKDVNGSPKLFSTAEMDATLHGFFPAEHLADVLVHSSDDRKPPPAVNGSLLTFDSTGELDMAMLEHESNVKEKLLGVGACSVDVTLKWRVEQIAVHMEKTGRMAYFLAYVLTTG
mmetsp:Transcript_8743/g.13058  ORF Transcript_8743/g.13058 Transcript_8743/m.13058 type:complete len:482 (-) Transcript_8743:52-1497(-)|eukprot:CAMPEP_0185032000 /NCGR_PEP_ID=MMETSP1103-20130426/19811_1 /TAXON_ID=36769 /ORGANISM="Paraphysomonas bandaiensis, Strain Caron Lab Isolate" /LENGTH=481 /DNA_ID=CAMNT_0027567729 /DNA_START=32 /DNA_END=1477 /DNA_ORIENTATION=-